MAQFLFNWPLLYTFVSVLMLLVRHLAHKEPAIAIPCRCSPLGTRPNLDLLQLSKPVKHRPKCVSVHVPKSLLSYEIDGMENLTVGMAS